MSWIRCLAFYFGVVESQRKVGPGSCAQRGCLGIDELHLWIWTMDQRLKLSRAVKQTGSAGDCVLVHWNMCKKKKVENTMESKTQWKLTSLERWLTWLCGGQFLAVIPGCRGRIVRNAATNLSTVAIVPARELSIVKAPVSTATQRSSHATSWPHPLAVPKRASSVRRHLHPSPFRLAMPTTSVYRNRKAPRWTESLPRTSWSMVKRARNNAISHLPH